MHYSCKFWQKSQVHTHFVAHFFAVTARLGREIPLCDFSCRTYKTVLFAGYYKTDDEEFFSLVPGKFTYIWDFNRIGIMATFNSNIFAAFIVVVTEAPYYWKTTLIMLIFCWCTNNFLLYSQRIKLMPVRWNLVKRGLALLDSVNSSLTMCLIWNWSPLCFLILSRFGKVLFILNN